MGFPTKFPTIIHAAPDADFNKYVYFKVYAGSSTTAIINGTSVIMAAGSIIEIPVTSISGSNVYVLGSPMNTVSGLSYNGYDTEMLGGSAFLDITP